MMMKNKFNQLSDVEYKRDCELERCQLNRKRNTDSINEATKIFDKFNIPYDKKYIALKLKEININIEEQTSKINDKYKNELLTINQELKVMENITGLKICYNCKGSGRTSKIDAAGQIERSQCNCLNGFIAL